MFTKLMRGRSDGVYRFSSFGEHRWHLARLPMTGITLPFVSHGGFSLITSFAMLGMLMAFSSRNARDRVIAEMPAVKSSSPLKLEAVE